MLALSSSGSDGHCAEGGSSLLDRFNSLMGGFDDLQISSPPLHRENDKEGEKENNTPSILSTAATTTISQTKKGQPSFNSLAAPSLCFSASPSASSFHGARPHREADAAAVSSFVSSVSSVPVVSLGGSADPSSLHVEEDLDEMDAFELMADGAWAAGDHTRAVGLLRKAVSASVKALSSLLQQQQHRGRVSLSSPLTAVAAQMSASLCDIRAAQRHSATLQTKLAGWLAATGGSGDGVASPCSSACINTIAGTASKPFASGARGLSTATTTTTPAAACCNVCLRPLLPHSARHSVQQADVALPRFCSNCGSPTPPRLVAASGSPLTLVARRLY